MNGHCLSKLGFIALLALLPNTSLADERFIHWSSVSGGIDHTYLYVYGPGLNWDQANAAAQARTFLGEQGYLATITSAAENLFITTGFSDAAHFGRIGFGLLDDPSRWITGEPFAYSNWAPNEPNSTQEDIGHIYFAADGFNGRWNDLARSESLDGYLVEFNAVPEPCCTLLLLTGAALLESISGRRHRRLTSVP